MKKLTRREADFESLIEAAILLEGRCERAAHGCKCRGCDECEENYQTMSGDEEENLTLDELINRELGPEMGDRYEYEGEDPYYEYDEEQESQSKESQSKLANAIKFLEITDPAKKENMVNSARYAAGRVIQTAVDALKKP
jgi:hypothetical protein